MTKEYIESLIWKCFECKMLFFGDGTFEYYSLDGHQEITLRFFNYEDFEEYEGIRDSFAWGVILKNSDEDTYHFFPVYDYFDGTPVDLLENADRVVSDMAEDILKYIGEE